MARNVNCIRPDKYAPSTFGIISVEGGGKAIGKLPIDGLRLYIHLCAHCSNGAHWQLSPSAVQKESGLGDSVSKNVVNRGFDQLVAAGFIKLNEGSVTSGVFYPDGYSEDSV